MRFPVDLSGGNPNIIFMSREAKYMDGGGAGTSIALYAPLNYSINDQLVYDTHQGGMITSIQSAMDQDDGLLDRAISAVGAVSGQATTWGKRGLARVGGGILPGVSEEAIVAKYNLSKGKVTNPNEFLLFKSPSLRTFSFNFDLVPKRQEDVDAMFNIIKKFRMDAYPGLADGGFDYTIPNIFKIHIRPDDGKIYIKVPDCVCTGIQTVYNPDSMSYFKYRDAPSKITLSLTFQETHQLLRSDVQAGY